MSTHIDKNTTLEEGLLSRSKLSDDSPRTSDSETSVSIDRHDATGKCRRRREVLLCVFGTVTLVVGVVLILVAVFLMEGDCHCQPVSVFLTFLPILLSLL